MKSFLISILILVLSAVSVFAADSIQSKALFTAQATTGTSAVVNTGLFTKKTVVVNGIYSGGTYGNYSGTFVLQGAPTATGPWVTLKDKGNAATSATTNTVFNLDDNVQFIRASWTKTKHNISAWLYYAK